VFDRIFLKFFFTSILKETKGKKSFLGKEKEKKKEKKLRKKNLKKKLKKKIKKRKKNYTILFSPIS